MEPSGQVRFASRAAFLDWETAREERWEFIDSDARRLDGGRVIDNVISGNIFFRLRESARRLGFAAFIHGQKLAPTATSDVLYPAVFVTAAAFLGDDFTVAGAMVAVELLSPATVEADLERRTAIYRAIPEMRHLLIVDTDRPAVLHHRRDAVDDAWRVQFVEGLEAMVRLDALGIDLPLSAIYEDTSLLT